MIIEGNVNITIPKKVIKEVTVEYDKKVPMVLSPRIKHITPKNQFYGLIFMLGWEEFKKSNLSKEATMKKIEEFYEVDKNGS